LKRPNDPETLIGLQRDLFGALLHAGLSSTAFSGTPRQRALREQHLAMQPRSARAALRGKAKSRPLTSGRDFLPLRRSKFRSIVADNQ
jgi:hypothetical protein